MNFWKFEKLIYYFYQNPSNNCLVISILKFFEIQHRLMIKLFAKHGQTVLIIQYFILKRDYCLIEIVRLI